MSDGPTTDRAQRQRAVASGDATDAVEPVSPQSNPGGRSLEGSTRSRLRETRREVASEAGVDRGGVGAIDRLRGSDVFLRSSGVEQFGATVAEQFAGAADFVSEQDVDPNVNAQSISADPVVAPGRRDDVAQRAREQTASEDQYAAPADFEAEVGGLGVTSIGLTDMGARRRAGREFEATTPLDSVDPNSDVTPVESGGFELSASAQRRSAVRGYEDDYDTFGQGSLTPANVRETESGFGLRREPARNLAAAQLDAEYDEVNVSPSDVTLTETDSGAFEASFEVTR